jgi:hypothetical protein
MSLESQLAKAENNLQTALTKTKMRAAGQMKKEILGK